MAHSCINPITVIDWWTHCKTSAYSIGSPFCRYIPYGMSAGRECTVCTPYHELRCQISEVNGREKTKRLFRRYRSQRLVPGRQAAQSSTGKTNNRAHSVLGCVPVCVCVCVCQSVMAIAPPPWGSTRYTLESITLTDQPPCLAANPLLLCLSIHVVSIASFSMRYYSSYHFVSENISFLQPYMPIQMHINTFLTYV